MSSGARTASMADSAAPTTQTAMSTRQAVRTRSPGRGRRRVRDSEGLSCRSSRPAWAGSSRRHGTGRAGAGMIAPSVARVPDGLDFVGFMAGGDGAAGGAFRSVNQRMTT